MLGTHSIPTVSQAPELPPRVDLGSVNGSRTAGNMQNKIGPDVMMQGMLVLSAPTVFEGRLEGEIRAQAPLHLGPKAIIKADITGTTVIVEGKIQGKLNASERVELRGGAEYYGDISCGKLVMEESVTLVGNVKITSGKESKEVFEQVALK